LRIIFSSSDLAAVPYDAFILHQPTLAILAKGFHLSTGMRERAVAGVMQGRWRWICSNDAPRMK
jgi:hypothetical protein